MVIFLSIGWPTGLCCDIWKGVRNVMYGGNANFYNIEVSEYAAVVDALAAAAGAQTWVLPSVGPDYGKLMDQAAILRTRDFPTAMLLPMAFPYTDAGLADGVRRFTDRLGRPAVLYIKAANYLAPATLAQLIEEGRIVAVKYAVVRADPAQDDYLAALLQEVDAQHVVSGIGERPAIVHFRRFGLKSFTSGSVCVAPRGSMQLLRSLQAGQFEQAERLRATYMPLEDCRDEISPIRVLHEAVTLAGVADMGPMLPLLSGLDAAERARVAPVARALREQDGQATRLP
ncbi:dihydrodipicolinate synthetase domain protein [Bordetella holmesii CDC-H635-BH]|uniref:Dihydrodipicolinate synthetase domain protein n=2 Tax=Bordetella holmesii TaxID=35814 RepID=A0A158M3G6_9BORD|nr:dihydrodipicolinate synthetase family protein [Bordetella holmesii 70147]KAK82028.1 dihydrodipicolinate synthetase domain protein [Bordetella holmesii CDC-H809-BH]KAK87110.1 dihydrodipicolinate synthetase domain protein [Bordetella holmesii CDC-H572-BH]KAK88066.1 dihydrodipicolinate synthetase domain protein [Bordetella holmesii H620]KAK89629.1 dihydrodipicolinate synthetase domain protein [Bordetella holmesii CDC-H585-BH]KAL02975.1 dihydrodipicolinate synthetase domain protein [Bordetella 